MPKPPPTSGVVTRTASVGRPELVGELVAAAPQTPWPEKPTCIRPSVPFGGGAARLHRVRHHPVVDELEPGACARPRRRSRVDLGLVAEGPVVGEVLRRLGMDRRPADRRSRRAPAVVEIAGDQLGGVERGRPGLGDDHRDRLADVADAVVGQHRPRAAPAPREPSRFSPSRSPSRSASCRRSRAAVKTASTPGAAAAVGDVEAARCGRARPGCGRRPRARRPPGATSSR